MKQKIHNPAFIEVFKHTSEYGPITSRDLKLLLHLAEFVAEKEQYHSSDEDTQYIIDTFTDWIEELEEI